MWFDNEISKGILEKKYYHDGENDPYDFIDRVCNIYSDNVKKDLRPALLNADFCLAGRSLYGAGYKGNKKVSMSNCYICDEVEDSLSSINNVDLQMSIIGSRGGGVGVSLDNIRPKGAVINNSARISDGVEFVLRKFNQTGESIGQYTRRMAMMMTLICTHPDIYEFLHIKENNEKLSAMNISIKFTDEFMEAVKADKPYTLSFIVKDTGEKISKTINAKEFFDEFCVVNKDWGDPGCIFIDRVRNYNLLSGYKDYVINTSNPCSEFFGNAGNSCNLASINLYNIVDNKFESSATINYTKLETLVRMGVRALNETLDYGYSMQPLDKNRTCITDWRSIGLGVFGLADMFIALKVPYGSTEAIDYISEIFDFINIVALDESADLAEKYGTFGKYDWDKTKESKLIKSLLIGHKDLYNKIKKVGLRNGTLLSIAPTGTISLLMGGFSGGVEPLFKIGYKRSTHSMEKTGKTFTVYAKSVHDLLQHDGVTDNLSNDEVKAMYPFILESHDVEPINRIMTQSIMQEYVDNAISSTINLPKGTSSSTIADIYIKAWEQGLKGITVFVDGCKRGNILGVDETKKDNKSDILTDGNNIVSYDTVKPISRRGEKEVAGKTYKLETACVPKFYVHVNKTDDGDIFEVFASPSSGCVSNITTITRLVSTMLRCGISVETIIEDLGKTKCPACQNVIRSGKKDISLSCGNAIADALRKAYEEANATTIKDEDLLIASKEVEHDSDGLLKCPKCGEKTLRLEAKCVTCDHCGYSLCS